MKNINILQQRISSLKLVVIGVIFLIPLNLMAQENSFGYQITSPVSGVVARVYVKEGGSVKKGDLLLDYDMELFNSNLSEAKAVMALARINLSEVKKELERAEELYERTVLSEHDLQKAKVDYAKASAQYAQARNKLTHAKWYITHSKLYAPFPGTVTKVYSYNGQYINNEFTAQPLFMIQ